MWGRDAEPAPEGVGLTLPEAFSLGRRLFGGLLDAAPGPRPPGARGGVP